MPPTVLSADVISMSKRFKTLIKTIWTKAFWISQVCTAENKTFQNF